MIKRQTVILVFSSLLLLLAGAVAGENSGLVGSWSIDTKKSDPFRPGMAVPNITMTVAQSGNEVEISQTFELQGQSGNIAYTYVTDNVERELPAFTGGTRMAKAQWKKTKLVVRNKSERETPQGTFEIETVETWKLSKDGSQLTIDYSTRLGQRSFTVRHLYNRQ